MHREREMPEADTILSIIRERGKKGLPLERIYRLLFNPDLYLSLPSYSILPFVGVDKQ